jgi:octaprenyl-diphosphate synthase
MLNSQKKEVPDSMEQIYSFLGAEIVSLNRVISSCFREQTDILKEVAQHFLNSRGRRIRPILTILTSNMLGYSGPNHIKLAAAVELIHTATLLHDDVIDESKIRRGLPTANSLWGNKASILSGDFFFSKSFKLMVATGSLPSLELLAKTSSEIVQGEIRQLVNLQKQLFISQEEYFEIIDYKTAKLFAAACEVAVIITNASDKDLRLKLNKFGSLLGLAYQVKDDILDYFGDATGKEKGIDFKEGKITLPVIILYEKATYLEKQFISDVFTNEINRNTQNFGRILNLMKNYQVYESIVATIKDLLNQSRIFLAGVQVENESKQFLFDLIDFISVKDL